MNYYGYPAGVLQPNDKAILQRFDVSFDLKESLRFYRMSMKPDFGSGNVILFLNFYTTTTFTLGDMPAVNVSIGLYGSFTDPSIVNLTNSLQIMTNQWNTFNLNLRDILDAKNVNLNNYASMLLGLIVRGSVVVRFKDVLLVCSLINSI